LDRACLFFIVMDTTPISYCMWNYTHSLFYVERVIPIPCFMRNGLHPFLVLCRPFRALFCMIMEFAHSLLYKERATPILYCMRNGFIPIPCFMRNGLHPFLVLCRPFRALFCMIMEFAHSLLYMERATPIPCFMRNGLHPFLVLFRPFRALFCMIMEFAHSLLYMERATPIFYCISCLLGLVSLK